LTEVPLERRTWCYIQPPASYGIAPCPCGNSETQWSEFKDHLWCDKCEKDFIPEHHGVFDGPIPVAVSMMLGMSFDTINLETNEVEPFTMSPLDRAWIETSLRQR
jgi:hypothetical protein